MGDLSRERLAQLREMCRSRRESLSWQDIAALLSMAERAVSVETVRKLVPLLDDKTWSEGRASQFYTAVIVDLRAAATSLKETE